MFDRSHDTGRRPARGWPFLLLAIVLLAASVAGPRALARPAPQGGVGTPPVVLPTPAAPRPSAASPSAIGLWTPASPADTQLPTVDAIAMNGPALSENTSIVIATDRGVYRSNNGGSNWSDWSTDLPSRAVKALVVDRAGTFYAVASGLVFRHTSSEGAWVDYSTNLPRPRGIVSRLAISTDGTLFAAATSAGSVSVPRVFWRPLGGNGWADFSAGLPANSIIALAIGAAEVYASTGNDLFASPRNQPHWVSIKNIGGLPLPLNDNNIRALAVGPEDELYAGLIAKTNAGVGGVWRTTNMPCLALSTAPSRSTGCWELLNGTTPSTLNGVGVLSLLVAPDNRVYVGSANGLYRNGIEAEETSWSRLWPSNVELLALALSPTAVSSSSPADNVLFAGTTDGVMRSLNLGDDLEPINEGLSRGLTIDTLAFANDGTLFAATTGRAYRSTDAGAGWTTIRQVSNLTSLAPSANYATDGSIFAASCDQLSISNNRGAAWTILRMPRGCSDILLPSPTIQSDNTIFAAYSDRALLLGLNSVIRSIDRGNTWNDIGTGLGGQTLHTLAINPSPGGAPYLLAGTNTGIFAFHRNTSTWSSFNSGDLATPAPIRQIAFSPNVAHDGALFALGDTGLYRYSPAAAQGWKRLPATHLPLSAVQTFAVSPSFAGDQILFAITNHDVWISSDGGGTWEPVRRSGLPDRDLLSLAIAPDFASSRTIFVGTNGGGIFKYTLPPPAPAWLVLLYLAGDDRGTNSLSGPIDQLKGRLGALDNRDVRVVALYDGNQAGDSRIYVRDPGADGLQAISPPAVLPGTEWDTGSVATLQNFIRWALDTYPGSRHTMLSIVDHGGGWAPDFGNPGQSESELAFQAGGWRGMSLDASSGSSLSTRDTGQALAQALSAGEHFDIVFFDACLMGMLESLYQVQPYADYMIAGENILWAALPYERYLAPDVLSAATTPPQLAQAIVKLYNSRDNNSASPSNQPFVIAALDMQKLGGLPAQVDALAQRLLGELANPMTHTQIVDSIFDAYHHAQKFDYDTSLTLDDTDGYVDLSDFARKLDVDGVSKPVREAAQAVYMAIGGRAEPNRVVIGSAKIVSGKPDIAPETWNLDNAYGLSIYLPLGEKDCRPSGPPRKAGDPAAVGFCAAPPTALPGDPIIEPQLPYYVDANQLAFTHDAPHWAELLQQLSEAVPPRKPGKPPFRSPAQLPTTWRRYLPVIAYGARPDLVVGDITTVPETPVAGQPAEVRVKIKNIGSRDITSPFWVDLYVDLLNPAITPDVNRAWPDVSPYGAAWRVYSLGAGDELTLSTLHTGDPANAGGRYSFFPGFVRSGAHMLYALVDSYAEGQPYGAIAEADERIESNRRGPVVLVAAPQAASALEERGER